MTIAQADRDASDRILKAWRVETNASMAYGFANAFATHAQAAADQRQAEIVAWLRKVGTDADGHFPQGGTAMRRAADAIESGTWRTE